MRKHAVQTRPLERRLSFERRSFEYSNHIPERRTGRDRREMPADAIAEDIHPYRIGQRKGVEHAGFVFKVISGQIDGA